MFSEAEKLAASGEITFDPCHMHDAVGPMAGVVTASMPVWILENKTFGNRAYCTINEGLGKVLRFGAFDDEVLKRLRWMERELYPVLKEAVAIKGEIDVKVLIAKLLQMGDEAHNRNEAGTSLLLRELVPRDHELLQDTGAEDRRVQLHQRQQPHLLEYLYARDEMHARPDLRYPLLHGGCNHVPQWYGLRHPHRGTRQKSLVHREAEMVKGLYFPGYSEADAARDLGDSCITETAGIGGFCMAAAPAIVQFVGGQVSDAINYSTRMYEITVGEGRAYKIPALDFRGSPTGIDIRKVMETGIRPVINTGIAHKNPGVGQVGAGIVNPPEDCFKQAIAACAEAWTK